MLLVEEQAASPVHVHLGTPEIIDRYHNPRRQRLQFPSAAVVAQPPDRPNEHWRRGYMKQAQETNEERQPRIKHILRAADDVTTGRQSPGKVHNIERLEQQ